MFVLFSVVLPYGIQIANITFLLQFGKWFLCSRWQIADSLLLLRAGGRFGTGLDHYNNKGMATDKMSISRKNVNTKH